MHEPDEPKAKEKDAGQADPEAERLAKEQMERFEEDLKENDWGHQPC